MASQRCPRCAIDYPGHFLSCLVKECRAKLMKSPHGTPDENWEAKVSRRNDNGGVDIHVDAQGQRWLTNDDADLLGFIMAPGTILELGGVFYEVNGYVRSRSAYWLEEVIVDGAADSLEPAMFRGPEA